MELGILALVAAVGLALYFLPAIIAGYRNHRQFVPILLLTFFLGWTMLGWVGALVWASMNTMSEVTTRRHSFRRRYE